MGDIEIIRIIVVTAMAIGGLTMVSAIARRIAGPYGRRFRAQQMMMGLGGGVDAAEHDALREEVARLKAELDAVQERVAGIDELQNRLDFTERMIGQMKNKPQLPGSSA